jgi:hypothetical protein
MGLIERVLGVVFGNGRNVITETAEVFRVNAEADALRGATMRADALQQFSQEFAQPEQGRFDRFMDGVNRIPRPAMALGTLGLFVAAMVDPVWFAARMTGIALVPEPLWWLLGAIVSFYFGARHQLKGQTHHSQLARTMGMTPRVVQAVGEIEALRDKPSDVSAARGVDPAPLGVSTASNPALAEWRAKQAATM